MSSRFREAPVRIFTPMAGDALFLDAGHEARDEGLSWSWLGFSFASNLNGNLIDEGTEYGH